MCVKYSGRERAAAVPWPRAEKALRLEGFGWRRRLTADFASDTPRTVASSSFPFTAVAYVTSGPHRSEGSAFRNGDKEPMNLAQESLPPRPKIVNGTFRIRRLSSKSLFLLSQSISRKFMLIKFKIYSKLVKDRRA